MKIKRVYEDFKYSPEMLNNIEDNWEDKIIYYVASPRNKRPDQEPGYDNIENAIKSAENLNMEWNEQTFCIFEAKIRVLTDEEINLLLNSKKYNI